VVLMNRVVKDRIGLNTLNPRKKDFSDRDDKHVAPEVHNFPPTIISTSIFQTSSEFLSIF
jgi:hypothetical protein